AGIADGRSLAHRALTRQAAAAHENSLKQAGLPALEWPYDGDETRTGNAVLVIGCGQCWAPQELARHPARRRRNLDLRGPAASLAKATHVCRASVAFPTWSQDQGRRARWSKVRRAVDSGGGRRSHSPRVSCKRRASTEMREGS